MNIYKSHILKIISFSKIVHFIKDKRTYLEKEIGKLRKYIISQIKLQKITLQQSIWKQENKFKKYLIILCIHHIYILHSNT